MNRTTAIMILLFAAALEAGGDAIIRMASIRIRLGIVTSCLRQPRSFFSRMA